MDIYEPQTLARTHPRPHSGDYLYVELTCDREATVLEPHVKLLGKDERVRAERVPAEG